MVRSEESDVRLHLERMCSLALNAGSSSIKWKLYGGAGDVVGHGAASDIAGDAPTLSAAWHGEATKQTRLEPDDAYDKGAFLPFCPALTPQCSVSSSRKSTSTPSRPRSRLWRTASCTGALIRSLSSFEGATRTTRCWRRWIESALSLHCT